MRVKPGSPIHKKLVAQGRIEPESGQPRNKWGNQPTVDSEGVLHPSKLQARVTDRERSLNHAVIHEVSMPLSERPRDRIRIDALVIQSVLQDGYFIGKFVEAKGKDLGEGKQKRRRFEDKYGIPIEVKTK